MDNIYLELIVNALDQEGERTESKITITSEQLTFLEIVNNPQTIFPYAKVSFNIAQSEYKLFNFIDSELLIGTINLKHQDYLKTYDCYIYSYLGTEKGNIEDDNHLYDISAKIICIDPNKIRLFVEDNESTGTYRESSLSLLKKICGDYDVYFHKDTYTDDYMIWKRNYMNDVQFINYIKERMDINIPAIVLKNDITSSGQSKNQIFISDFERMIDEKNANDDNTIILNYSNVTVSNSIKNYEGNKKSSKVLVTYNKNKIGFDNNKYIEVGNSDKMNILSDDTYGNYLNHVDSNIHNVSDVIKKSGEIILNNIDLIDYKKLELLNYIDIDGDLYIITQFYHKYIQRNKKPITVLKVYKIR